MYTSDLRKLPALIYSILVCYSVISIKQSNASLQSCLGKAKKKIVDYMFSNAMSNLFITSFPFNASKAFL